MICQSADRVRPGLFALLLLTLLGACAGLPPEDDRRAVRPRITPVVGAPATARRPPTVPSPVKGCANCPTADKDYAPDSDEIPADVAGTPDAVPVAEAKSRYGNPENYDALGEHYVVVQKTPRGFRETGKASWYGKKFHGRRTANGEAYDMFKMTAAHKTLPLPSYARVTNRRNNRSVVVRINDRGPFHPGRIVDLSYAAAARLGMLQYGETEVTLEVLTPEDSGNAFEPSAGTPRYLEVGRYDDPIDAIARQDRLVTLGFPDTELLTVSNPAGDGRLTVLRIGPFKDFTSLEKKRRLLESKQISAVPLVD